MSDVPKPSRDRRPRLGSIRAHVALLTAAALLPLLGVVGYGTVRQFQAASRAAEGNLLVLAGAAATDVHQFLQDVKSLLEAMAQRPGVRALDPSRCDQVAVEAPLFLRQLGHSMIMDERGQLVCTTLPPPPGEDRLRDASMRTYFQEVARTRRFFVDQPRLGYVSGRNVAVMASPILAPDGAFLGATSVSVDLVRLQGYLDALSLTEESVVTIADSSGVVVARSEHPDEWVGDTLPRFATANPYVLGRGISRGPDLEGRQRTWGFAAVPDSPWIVFVGLPTEAIGAPARRAATDAVLAGLLALLAVAAVSSFLYRRVTGSLASLEDGIAGVFAGKLDSIPAGDLEEVARVSDHFNRALRARVEAEDRRRAAEEQLATSQRMDAVGRLAGGVAHDFNNLLTVINGQAEMLLAELPEGSQREDVEEILNAGTHASELTRQLLAFGRKEVSAPRRLDPNVVVEEACRILGRLLPESIELHVDLADEVHAVLADPGQLERVVMNLVLNARDAIEGRGVIRIRTSNVDVPDPNGFPGTPAPGPYVRLSVRDDGHGIALELRDRIFEPFVSGKPRERGTGLGLAVVFGIVGQGGGFVNVDSAPDQGAEFQVYLPSADDTPS